MAGRALSTHLSSWVYRWWRFHFASRRRTLTRSVVLTLEQLDERAAPTALGMVGTEELATRPQLSHFSNVMRHDADATRHTSLLTEETYRPPLQFLDTLRERKADDDEVRRETPQEQAFASFSHGKADETAGDS